MIHVSSQLNGIILRDKRIIRQSDSIVSTPLLQYQTSNRLLDASVLINMTTCIFIPLAFLLSIHCKHNHTLVIGEQTYRQKKSQSRFLYVFIIAHSNVYTHTLTHITFALPLIFPHHLINIVAVLRSP